MFGGRVALGPMKMRASFHETIWGGQRLRELAGKALPAGRLIGESWETAVDSLILEGPHEGETLGAVVEAHGPEFLGARAAAVYGNRFPLLAKFLDAQQWLSVQAHPDDAYAALHEGGKLGKTEAWYILEATPGAQIIYGMRRAVSRAEVRAAIEATRLEDLLQTVEVQAGDVIFVPAGTVHAIGSGVALYELQEYSDVTYRLYDYGRVQADGHPRDLHVERALDVARYEPSPVAKVSPCVIHADGQTILRVLVACDYFVEEELRLAGRFEGVASDASVQIITMLEGACELRAPSARPMRLALGDTAVLPARLGAYSLEGAARVVRAYVPERDDPGLARWRAAQTAAESSR